jgi:plastocyanin
MKKVLITLLVVIVLAAVGWAAYGIKKPSSSPTGGTDTTKSTQTDTGSSDSTAAGAVDIKNMMFTPSQISVKKGATVTWTNNDTVAHTVTDDLTNVGGPASGSIAPGATYSFTFEKTGSFQYHCKFHTSMRGTIVVQ